MGTEQICEETVETKNSVYAVPDLHWCNEGEDGHIGAHRCSCGLVWTDEVPC